MVFIRLHLPLHVETQYKVNHLSYRADALDHAAAQVFLDALPRSRRRAGQHLRPELKAKLTTSRGRFRPSRNLDDFVNS
jgi:hypothetical protein